MLADQSPTITARMFEAIYDERMTRQKVQISLVRLSLSLLVGLLTLLTIAVPLELRKLRQNR